MGKILNRHFTKENIQVASVCTKNHSPSLVIKEMQMKNTVRYHDTLLRKINIQRTDNIICWHRYGATRTLSSTLSGRVK